MSEENRERKLAEAKKKFRGYHQWNNAGVGTGGTDTKKKINNGTNPETTTSGGCHSPEDVSLGWLEKAASHQHQEALRRELETQDHTIRILTSQKTELETGLYYSQEAARKCEGGNLGTRSSFHLALSQAFRGSPSCHISTSLIPGESKDLAGRLHRSWHFAAESQQALSAASTQHKKADRVSPTTLSLECYHFITNEELKAKNAELQEKLRLVESEKSEIQLNVKELKMKLERDKILLPQVETNTLQKEKLQEQEKKIWEQEEKIREQEEKMWRQEERLLPEQEEELWKQEKIQEQEEKMQGQEKNMQEKEERMREQEEKLPEHKERCSAPCVPPSKDLCDTSHASSIASARGEAGDGSPHDNPTAQVVHLPCGMKNAQERPGLGSNSCIPFFYRGDKKMKIIDI
uniref:Golgin subfamily A conserved domain-containing protein n=1 Tax=Cercocebus atys TaxID=9531 RepID=A0A2K5LWC9_CERAT